MPVRWVINPVLEEVVDGTTYQRPKVTTLLDPGRAGKTYKHTTVILGGGWCLSCVRGANMTALDNDAQCVNLLETDYEDAENRLVSTVRDLNWTVAKRNRVLQRLTDKGIDTTGITLDTALWQILLRVAQALQSNFTRERLEKMYVR